MKKGLVALFLATVAFASGATFDEPVVLQDDPFLNRVVQDAIDLGESSLIEMSLAHPTKTRLSLEHPHELESSLLSISSEILGTPITPIPNNAATAAAPQAPQASASESAQLRALLQSSEAKLIEDKKAEILAEKQKDQAILASFNSLSNTINKFDADLNAEENDSLGALLESQTETETETETESKPSMTAEQQLQAEIESEMDAEKQSAESKADAEIEAEFDLSDEAMFMQLETLISSSDLASLKDALTAVENPSAEQEILEPTLLEEAEMAELTQSQEYPTQSFILTQEELTAQLDALAKEM